MHHVSFDVSIHISGQHIVIIIIVVVVINAQFETMPTAIFDMQGQIARCGTEKYRASNTDGGA